MTGFQSPVALLRTVCCRTIESGLKQSPDLPLTASSLPLTLGQGPWRTPSPMKGTRGFLIRDGRQRKGVLTETEHIDGPLLHASIQP